MHPSHRKADREDTPDPDAFDMTFTVSGNDLAAQITTDRTDVEFSFDGTDWGQTKSTRSRSQREGDCTDPLCETMIITQSPAVSKTWNSGHGPLNRRPGGTHLVRQREHRILDLRRLRTVFCIRRRKQSITATEIVLPKTDHSWAEGYLSDMTGHWHKCGVCGIASNTEKMQPVAATTRTGGNLYDLRL